MNRAASSTATCGEGSIGEAASRRFGYQVAFGWALIHQQEVGTAVTFERS
jgi:hypothetical protein